MKCKPNMSRDAPELIRTVPFIYSIEQSSRVRQALLHMFQFYAHVGSVYFQSIHLARASTSLRSSISRADMQHFSKWTIGAASTDRQGTAVWGAVRIQTYECLMFTFAAAFAAVCSRAAAPVSFRMFPYGGICPVFFTLTLFHSLVRLFAPFFVVVKPMSFTSGMDTSMCRKYWFVCGVHFCSTVRHQAVRSGVHTQPRKPVRNRAAGRDGTVSQSERYFKGHFSRSVTGAGTGSAKYGTACNEAK